MFEFSSRFDTVARTVVLAVFLLNLLPCPRCSSPSRWLDSRCSALCPFRLCSLGVRLTCETDPADGPRLFYHLTKDVFPQAYFSKMLKGEWYGPRGVFPPQFVPS
jgi:hypothetical protein